jgi:hypothetical protein
MSLGIPRLGPDSSGNPESDFHFTGRSSDGEVKTLSTLGGAKTTLAERFVEEVQHGF